MLTNAMCSLPPVRGASVASPLGVRRAYGGSLPSSARRPLPVSRAAVLRVNASSEPSPLDGKKSRCLPLPIAQPQGYMWSSIRKLRPSTEEEATCEPKKDACSLAYIAMKYDEKCVSCGGTGLVKTSAFKSSRKKSKSTTGRCMLCAGIGYVRVNTVRVEPDFSKNDSMPADYDPQNFGFPKGEQGPFCEVKEKSWKKNAGKEIGKSDNINIGKSGPR